jgi:hypothetical protein
VADLVREDGVDAGAYLVRVGAARVDRMQSDRYGVSHWRHNRAGVAVVTPRDYCVERPRVRCGQDYSDGGEQDPTQCQRSSLVQPGLCQLAARLRPLRHVDGHIFVALRKAMSCSPITTFERAREQLGDLAPVADRRTPGNLS